MAIKSKPEPVWCESGGGRNVWFAGNLMTIKSGGRGADGMTVLLARMHPGHSPPLHVHHSDDEAFYLVEGTMRFRCGDDEFDASAGDFVLVPRGVPHAFKVGAHGVRALQVSTSGSLAAFIEAAGEPAPAPVMPPSTDYDRALIASAAERHDMILVGPPLP